MIDWLLNILSPSKGTTVKFKNSLSTTELYQELAARDTIENVAKIKCCNCDAPYVG